MTAINFPDAPAVDDQFTAGGRIWTWNGTSWNASPDVDTIIQQVSGAILDAAPDALNTLNELAAALGDDPDFSTTITTSLAAKAPTNSPTFTGTVSGVTKSHVGLGNVDNTSDADKPISTATQDALDLKADLESPVFTGDVDFSDATSLDLSTVTITRTPLKSGSSLQATGIVTSTAGNPVTLTSFTLPEAGTYAVSVNARANSQLGALGFGQYRIAAHRSTAGDFTIDALAGNLPVVSSSQVLLRANRTYALTANIDIRASFASFRWMTAANVQLGNLGASFSVNSTDIGSPSSAYAIFTPTTDTFVKLNLENIGGTSTNTSVNWGEISIVEIPTSTYWNQRQPVVEIRNASTSAVVGNPMRCSTALESTSSNTQILTVTGSTAFNVTGRDATSGSVSFVSDDTGRTSVSWFKLFL